MFSKGIPANQTPARALEIRNNFEALAATFFTQDANEPQNPERGWFRLIDEVNNPAFAGNIRHQWYDGAAWRTITQNIQGGVAAPTKIISAFSVPAVTWVVNHNLASKPLALVFDGAHQQLQPVQVFPREVIFLGHVDLSILASGVSSIVFPVRSEGRILETFAMAPTPISGPGTTATFDWAIDSTPSGGGLVPVVGGTVLVPSGGHPQGTTFPGGPVTAANVFSQHSGLGVEDFIVVTVPTNVPSAGRVDMFMVVERSLQPGQYRLVHINDNRFNVEHPALTTGSVIIVG